jgi:hypothetical protein
VGNDGWLSPESGGWNRLNVRVAVIAGVVGIPLTLLGIWLGITQLFDNPGNAPIVTVVNRVEPVAVRSVGEHVASCVARHHLAAAISVGSWKMNGHFSATHPAPEGKPFEARNEGICTWPPIGGSRQDGFYTVNASMTWIPGDVGADPYAMVDVIHAPCDRLRLRYVVNQMGGRAFNIGHIAVGQVVEVTTAERKNGAVFPKIAPLDEVPSDAAGFVPDPVVHAFTALESSHLTLASSVCVA